MNHKKLSDRPIWKEPAVVIGIFLTCLAVGYSWYSFSQNPVVGDVQDYPDKFTYLKYARPNEIGDALAGLAGSLALVWIVVTVWLQATELKEQRKELSEQREATQAMANAQARQVELLKVQGEIFSQEQEERRQFATAKIVDQVLEEIWWTAKQERALGGSWLRKQEHESDFGGFSVKVFPYETSANLDLAIRELAEFATKQIDFLLDKRENSKLAKLSANKQYFVELALRASEVQILRDGVSEEQLARLRKIKFFELASNLNRLIAADVWVEKDDGAFS
jgi:hypothetical protein